MFNLRNTALVSTLALLTACGGGGGGTSGGGGGGGSTTPPAVSPVPDYSTKTLNSTTAGEVLNINGTAIRSNGSTGALDQTDISGTITVGGALNVTDGTYNLVDPDGVNASGVASDGAGGSLQTVNSNGTYEYVTGYTSTYTQGGVTYNSVGVTGVQTEVADVPTQGAVTYTGEANGTIVTGSTQTNLINGTSTVDVNYGTNTVDMTSTGFTATTAGGAASTAPIDTVSVTGMTITGNTFAGGTLATTNNGTAVDVTGANTTTSSSGVMYGYDASVYAPDEVGGVVSSVGDDATLGLIYIAD